MGNTWFQFQQFKIHQDRCAMKISTDAVLLGSLTVCDQADRILDIGTGTGVVALMLAQRSPNARITAIEIDAEAAVQAKDNFMESAFSSRIELVWGSFQDFEKAEKYDLIVSNPPYFPNHLKAKDPQRNKALHTDELSFDDLVKGVSSLLSPEGKFWVILPPRQMEELRWKFQNHHLKEVKTIQVQDRIDSKILREVSMFSKQDNPKISETLVLKDEKGSYTEAYKKLISGFLLGF